MSNCSNVRRSILNSTIGKMTKSYWIAQELVKTFSWICGWVGRTVCDCVSGWVCVRSVLGLCGGAVACLLLALLSLFWLSFSFVCGFLG
jgi:hypothetical protein